MLETENLSIEVTKEEFDRWLEMPVTKKVFQIILEQREYRQRVLNTADFSAMASPLLTTGELRGALCAYDSILEISWEEMENDE